MTTPTQQVFTLPLGERQIKVRALNEGQMLVATRIARAMERGEVYTGLMAFGDLLDAIVMEEDDRRYAYQGVVDGSIPHANYLDLLVGVINAMQADAQEGTNRAHKRATPRARR